MIPSRTHLLLGLLTLMPVAAGQDEVAPRAQLEQLTYQVVPSWEWELPVEVWRPLGERLDLGGVKFAVERRDKGLAIDTTGDGRADHPVSGSTHVVILRPAGGGFEYSIRLRRLKDRWDWAPAGSLSGRLAEVPIRVIDLNGDGRHDGYGVDGLLIGRGSYVGLLTRIASVNGALFELELTEDAQGARIESSPYAGPVARLDVTSRFESHGKLEAAFFQDGDVCIDVALGGGPTLVPAGEYRLLLGHVARGARTARIHPGRLPQVRLASGDEHVLEWGGELHAEFTYEVRGAQLVVHPNVRFYDGTGAEYADFQPVARPPLLNVRNAATGRLVQYGHFGGCCGGGYSAWKATVPAGLELVVELEHERRLFGKIAGAGKRSDKKVLADK